MAVRSTFQFPWPFFGIAFGWTWAFWVPVALSENGVISIPDGVAWLLADGKPAALGPLVAAVSIALAKGGICDLLGSMTRMKFALRWYLAALLLIPAIVGGAQMIAQISGEEVPMAEALLAPATIPIAFVWIFFLGGPLQEEAGWRGTATQSLQSQFGALGASLVTGLFWGVWHLPLFFMPRPEIYYNQPVWGLIGSTMLLSVLLTWVYNNTGRSLFAAMLMHTSWNWSNFIFTALQTDTGGAAFFALLAGVVMIIVVHFGPRDLTQNPVSGRSN